MPILLNIRNLIFLVLATFALISCNKGNDGNSGARTSLGGSAIFGQLFISPECGVPTATVFISPPMSSVPINTTSIANGGTFDFQVASGTYTVAAQAGACQLTPTQVPTVENRACPYTICLTMSSGCPQAQQSTSACGSPYAGGQFAYGGNTGYCSYGTYGCQGGYYPGTGNVGFGKPNLYMTAATTTEFELDIQFSAGNNAIASIPGLGMHGWKGTVTPEGAITVGSTKYPYLYYDVQADHKKFQYETGWCSPRDKVASEMHRYLKTEGFSKKPLDDFAAQVVTDRLPPQNTICVYPQNIEKISSVAGYNSSVDIEARRTWFILAPQNSTAVLEIKPIPAKFAPYFEKPKGDAFAALKKQGEPAFVTVKASEEQLKKTAKSAQRQVANRPVIKVEEWGMGFFLEK